MQIAWGNSNQASAWPPGDTSRVRRQRHARPPTTLAALLARPLPLAIVPRPPVLPDRASADTRFNALLGNSSRHAPSGPGDAIRSLLARNPALTEGAIYAALAVAGRDVPPRDALEQIAMPVIERFLDGKPVVTPPAPQLDDSQARRRAFDGWRLAQREGPEPLPPGWTG